MYEYTYKHLHKITISEKRGYELEGEQEGIYGKSWKKGKGAMQLYLKINT